MNAPEALRSIRYELLSYIQEKTVGNQSLKVCDFGKHNYAFSVKESADEFRLRLRTTCYYAEQEYASLEEKILQNKITLDEVVQFQQILDASVSKLLSLTPEEIFDVQARRCSDWPTERPTAYVTCSRCGEKVLRDRAMEFQGKILCIPCFQMLEPPGIGRSVH